jgi:hypothetical protein
VLERKQIVDGLIDYFKSDQWRRLMAILVQDPDPQGTHVHAYTETCVHPEDLKALICAYLELRGMPSSRKIDYTAPRPGEMGSLHGIEPLGKPHFDWNWFYNPGVALQATQGGAKGESGCNLCAWNRSYIKEYYADFKFRETIGAAEEEALRKYFRSEHWHKGLEISIDAHTTHGHMNVYTSVHPDVIQKFAEESIREKGWEIFYTCPNVYLVDGVYTGKLVFMGKNPEAVYDLGWMFKPDVVIEAAYDKWALSGKPGYDIWDWDMMQPIMDLPYVKLSDGEISQVIGTFSKGGG